MPKRLIEDYLKALTEAAKQGDAREESFYPSLEQFLEALAAAQGRAEVHVTTLPKKTEGGNSDFRVWNGQDRIIGYVEAKKPVEGNLDRFSRQDKGSDPIAHFYETFGATLRAGAAGDLGVPDRALPGAAQVAEGPPGAPAHAGRNPHLLQDRDRAGKDD